MNHRMNALCCCAILGSQHCMDVVVILGFICSSPHSDHPKQLRFILVTWIISKIAYLWTALVYFYIGDNNDSDHMVVWVDNTARPLFSYIQYYYTRPITISYHIHGAQYLDAYKY